MISITQSLYAFLIVYFHKNSHLLVLEGGESLIVYIYYNIMKIYIKRKVNAIFNLS